MRNQGLILAFFQYSKKIFQREAAIYRADVYSLHSTRHTALTLGLEATGDLHAVSQMAAHQSINTTERYLHTMEQYKSYTPKKIMERINHWKGGEA